MGKPSSFSFTGCGEMAAALDSSSSGSTNPTVHVRLMSPGPLAPWLAVSQIVSYKHARAELDPQREYHTKTDNTNHLKGVIMFTDEIITEFIRKADADCNIMITNPLVGRSMFEITIDTAHINNVLTSLSEIGVIGKITDDSEDGEYCYTFEFDYTDGPVFVEI